MVIILHIAGRKDWERAKGEEAYAPATYERDGFILCFGPAQLADVATVLFSGERDLMLLCIVVGKLRPPVSWEPFDILGDLAHVLGEVNTDSVVMAIDIAPNSEGKYELPKGIASYIG